MLFNKKVAKVEETVDDRKKRNLRVYSNYGNISVIGSLSTPWCKGLKNKKEEADELEVQNTEL